MLGRLIALFPADAYLDRWIIPNISTPTTLDMSSQPQAKILKNPIAAIEIHLQ